MCIRLHEIRQAEAQSHTEAYTQNALYSPGSWLAKPVKTVLELLPLLGGHDSIRALDLGCGVGRNAIAVAKAFSEIPCQIDCVDILPLAIEKLHENARLHGVRDAVNGIVSSIDDYEIGSDCYDLILAVSALEHVDSEETFLGKLEQIRAGIRPGGIVCLIVNSGITERDSITGAERPPQFEVNLPTAEMERLLARTFAGWEQIKHTVVHQKYDIPRGAWASSLETDVVTYVARKGW